MLPVRVSSILPFSLPPDKIAEKSKKRVKVRVGKRRFDGWKKGERRRARRMGKWRERVFLGPGEDSTSIRIRIKKEEEQYILIEADGHLQRIRYIETVLKSG